MPASYSVAGRALRAAASSPAERSAENIGASTPILPPGLYEVEATRRECGGLARLVVLDADREVTGTFFPRNDASARAEGRYLPPTAADGSVELAGYRFDALFVEILRELHEHPNPLGFCLGPPIPFYFGGLVVQARALVVFCGDWVVGAISPRRASPALAPGGSAA